ncbi:MAG: hypothetical protein N4A61_11095 [Pelagimonas sp.]|jgi:hypothetical protein|nr:hypothetical protein [Pelagimonas sp.]
MARLWFVVALCVGAGAFGFHEGGQRCEARHAIAAIEKAERAAQLDAERIEVARQRDNLVRELEELSNADPVVVERCIGPNRVRRLNALR